MNVGARRATKNGPRKKLSRIFRCRTALASFQVVNMFCLCIEQFYPVWIPVVMLLNIL